jgi:hypothetical protein
MWVTGVQTCALPICKFGKMAERVKDPEQCCRQQTQESREQAARQRTVWLMGAVEGALRGRGDVHNHVFCLICPSGSMSDVRRVTSPPPAGDRKPRHLVQRSQTYSSLTSIHLHRWWEILRLLAKIAFNLLEPKLFFLILAHFVYKMWIVQEPNKLELWNKMHFEEKKTESIYNVKSIRYVYLLNKYINCNFGG